jgi:hypothetical protein
MNRVPHTLLAGLDAERHCQMTLADFRWSEKLHFYNYERYGTINLFAALNVKTGL